MNTEWKVSCFKPEEPGVFPVPNGIRFAAEFPGDRECGIILYDRQGRKTKLPFLTEGRQGRLFGLQIEGKGVETCRYQYYYGEKIITDMYATKVSGLEKWGAGRTKSRTAYGGFETETFDWEGDEPLALPYEDTIIYGLNVRAFTMHNSSGVKHRGTFEGIIEKISYLKELGITAVLLMPCYEYEECMTLPVLQGQAAVNTESAFHAPQEEARLNCWGFQEGYYFSPKASYSADSSPSRSFKTMVKELHRNGIEVMMHFYFPPRIGQLYMLKVIRYWVKEYHIDGVRMSGFHIPFRLLAQEGFLGNTKIWCSYLPEDEMGDIENDFRNFACDNGNYRNDMRRFLKGDEGMLNAVLQYERCNPRKHGVINYFADYDGFSLYDSVSYERKHNEANGEDNRDGAELNFSWNCGVEGATKKKSVQQLRLKQMKNALTFLFLAQGTPFLFSGDEFANTRFGNNNGYCLDNALGWIKWKETQFSKELLAYAKFLIHLRKSYRIFHMKQEFRVMDSLGCGYPDISYHGTEAWRPDLSYVSRMAGAMLCGQYAKEKQFFYIACNMHWEAHQLALPKLPSGQAWVRISDTARAGTEETDGKETSIKTEELAVVSERSIAVYQSQPVEKSPEKGRYRRQKENGRKNK